MLGVLGNRLRPYVRQVPEGTRVFRARMKERGDAWSPCAKELGAPPFDKARAGRMNPAGIPYLYVAFDTKTALREIGESTAKPEATFMATRSEEDTSELQSLKRISYAVFCLNK